MAFVRLSSNRSSARVLSKTNTHKPNSDFGFISCAAIAPPDSNDGWVVLPYDFDQAGIINICLAAFVLLTMNFALGPLNNLGASVSQGWLNARKAMGMTGFLLVMLHALMSFLLFSPAVYGKFFGDNGTLTLSAGMAACHPSAWWRSRSLRPAT